jgi:hypothetical protein
LPLLGLQEWLAEYGLQDLFSNELASAFPNQQALAIGFQGFQAGQIRDELGLTGLAALGKASQLREALDKIVPKSQGSSNSVEYYYHYYCYYCPATNYRYIATTTTS